MVTPKTDALSSKRFLGALAAPSEWSCSMVELGELGQVETSLQGDSSFDTSVSSGCLTDNSFDSVSVNTPFVRTGIVHSDVPNFWVLRKSSLLAETCSASSLGSASNFSTKFGFDSVDLLLDI